jgi:hypothetical protein
MEQFLPFLGIPIVFIVFFVLFRYVFPRLGGWSTLAERYSTTLKSSQIDGERINFGEINVGGLNMKNMVRGYKTKEGLFLTQHFFFLGNAPNLLIPWEVFQTPERRDFLFMKRVRLYIGFPSATYLEMPEKKYRLLEDRLPKKLREG